MDGTDMRSWLALIMALAVLIVLAGGFINRYRERKGIGTQFIRCMVLLVSIPTIATLALAGALDQAAGTVIGTLAGFAFGQIARDGNKPA